MATAQQMLDKARENRSRTGSMIDLFKAKKIELEAALANQMTPDIQAAIDEVMDIETADAADMEAVLNANTPPPTPA